jgi:hypothetical protein
LPLFSPDSAMVIDAEGLSWEILSLGLSFNKSSRFVDFRKSTSWARDTLTRR